MNKIDFVIPWVDPSRDEWKKQKASYQRESGSDDRDARYRDWNQLKYVFRGIEKNCPWVRKVFLITSEEIPAWLDLNNEKVIHLKHSNYIPKEYLPTFSSHPIELNLWRIDELSERFVFFNDDMFLIRPLPEEVFFKDGLPVYPAILHASTSSDKSEIMPYIYLNNKLVINRHFSISDILRERSKWFSIRRNGLRSVIENCFNSRYPEIIGFYNSHLPTPFLKKTMKDVWNIEKSILEETSSHRFRTKEDVSQYLFRYFDLARGNFYPINPKKLGKEIDINTKNLDTICRVIRQKEVNMLCLNDSDEMKDESEFNEVRDKIVDAFEEIFPEKCIFEN